MPTNPTVAIQDIRMEGVKPYTTNFFPSKLRPFLATAAGTTTGAGSVLGGSAHYSAGVGTLILPDADDVRQGVIAARIAAHAANLARGIDRDIDFQFSTARNMLDWNQMFELCIDPKKAEKYRQRRAPIEDPQACSMCGRLCAIEMVKKYLTR